MTKEKGENRSKGVCWYNHTSKIFGTYSSKLPHLNSQSSIRQWTSTYSCGGIPMDFGIYFDSNKTKTWLWVPFTPISNYCTHGNCKAKDGSKHLLNFFLHYFSLITQSGTHCKGLNFHTLHSILGSISHQ